MSIATYRENHYACEAKLCGRPADHIHHIRTRGAGGSDEDENLLALCWRCHDELHKLGWKTWTFLHPHLRVKMAWAHQRKR